MNFKAAMESLEWAATEIERERCAKIAENPGFIQAQDTDWDLGVNYAKKFIAAAIRASLSENGTENVPDNVKTP